MIPTQAAEEQTPASKNNIHPEVVGADQLPGSNRPENSKGPVMTYTDSEKLVSVMDSFRAVIARQA
jgi:hypothetical protein